LAAHVPAADRRRQLIDAAIAVIANDGLSKATTRRITAHAGVPLAVMHYCFHSKEELLRAVAQEVTERTYPWVERVVTDGGLDVAIRSLIQELWEWLQREPDVQIALIEVLVWSVRNRREAGVDARVYQPTFELLSGRLELAAAKSEERCRLPLREVVQMIVAVVDGLFMQYLATGDRNAVESTLNHLADATISMAGATRDALDAKPVDTRRSRARTGAR
jgi:AcrR family transcriptional regulator